MSVTAAVLVVACSGGKETTGSSGGTTVASVQISGAPTAQLVTGDTVRLAAVALTSAGAPIPSQTVTWSSSAATVASVSSTGVVVAGEAGSATITASAGSQSAQITVDVAAGGTLTQAGGTITAAGGRFRVTVGGLPATTRMVVRQATTAPVDARTLASTVFEITPANLSFSGTSTLTLQFDPATLPAGLARESLQLYVLIGTTWTLVPQSTVNQVARTVTGTVSETGTYAVRSTPVDRIILSGTIVDGGMFIGDTATIGVTLRGGPLLDTLPKRPLTWTTSAPAVATVDSTGKVTAVGAGTVTISVATDGRVATSATTVTPRVIADWSRAVAEWSTFNGDARRTAYVDATVDPSVFRERWSRTPIPGANLYEATTGNGAVYAASFQRVANQALLALNPVDGTVRWQRSLPANSRVTQVATDGALVYLQTPNTGDGALAGLNASNGAEQFRSTYSTTVGPWLEAPIVSGTRVFIGSSSALYALSKTTGALSFTQAVGTVPTGFMAADATTLYYMDSGLYGVSQATGAVTLQRDDARFFDAFTPIVASAGIVVMRSISDVVAVNATSGAVAWSIEGDFSSTAAAAQGTLYLIEAGVITARSATTGAVQWTWTPPASAVCGGGDLVVTNNVLFVSCTDVTYALNMSTRLPVWSYPAGGELSLSGPQGMLYIASGDRLVGIALR